MIGAQNIANNAIDALSGQVSEWYDAVDSALTQSEIVNGTYRYHKSIPYGSTGALHNGQDIKLDMAAQPYSIIALENSYITCKQKIKIYVPAMYSNSHKHILKYYIGYKSSCDAISEYRISSGHDGEILGMKDPHFAWFMLYNSVSDEAKENSECYATLKKIRSLNPAVPGVYVEFLPEAFATGAKNREVEVEIPLKIPVNMFLELYNLKYFPNWAGSLTFDLWLSHLNLCVVPIVDDPVKMQAIFEYTKPDVFPAMTTTSGTTGYDGYLAAKNAATINLNDIPIDLGFNNFNYAVKSLVEFDGNNVALIGSQTFETHTSDPNGCVSEGIYLYTAEYQLTQPVFTALQMRYINPPMYFPMQTIKVGHFNLTIEPNTNTVADCLSFQHCDSMFVLFSDQEYHRRTCFINPFISYQINIDGTITPSEQYSTFDDIQNRNNLLDAFNVNNSLITSIPEDLNTSLQPYNNVYRELWGTVEAKATGTFTRGTTSIKPPQTVREWKLKDMSNFMIGYPLADSTDFQGGISTPGNAQIEFYVKSRDKGPTSIKSANIRVFGVYFQDAVLKVRGIHPAGRSQIELTHDTVATIVAGKSL